MEINKAEYTCFEEGLYRIGLSRSGIHEISSSSNFNESGLKVSFLEASVPEHAVHVEKFNISKRLVTALQFHEFIDDSGYVTEAEKDGWGWTWNNGWKKAINLSWKRPTGTLLDQIYAEKSAFFPVMQASYNDAEAYCFWVGKKTGKDIYIPSEPEWETFGRSEKCIKVSDSQGLYGERQTLKLFFQLLLSIAEKNKGEFPAGLMWEWTSSWYDVYPEGEGNSEFGKVYKVLKGGSLFSNAIQRMSWYRFRRCPTARSPFYGIRIAYRES